MEAKEILKQMLNDKINGDNESANNGIHDYIKIKMQELAGLSAPAYEADDDFE